MIQPDLTREKIINAALSRVSLDGLSNLSLSALADAVGMSKSGVYAHFGSKSGLELTVVEAIVQRFTATVWKPHEDKEPGLQRLRAIVGDWLRWVEGSVLPGGCPITTVAAELDDRPGQARDALATAEQRWVRVLAREFAALRGSVRITASDEQAAFELHNQVVGYGFFARFLRDEAAKVRFESAFDRLIRSHSAERS